MKAFFKHNRTKIKHN